MNAGKRARAGGDSEGPLAAEPRRLGPWTVLAALAVAAAWGYLFFAAEGGWVDLQERGAQLAELEAEVARLEAQNDSMRQVLHRLQYDPAYLEKVAREQFEMTRPGERLYRIRRPGGSGGQ